VYKVTKPRNAYEPTSGFHYITVADEDGNELKKRDCNDNNLDGIYSDL
jgi:hypothetical protein